MSLEAPVIPVEVGKEAVETTTKAVEVENGETLTEEMLYPDRAILTSTPYYLNVTDISLPRSGWYQTYLTCMGRWISRGEGTSTIF
jgi:hypothetical protein